MFRPAPQGSFAFTHLIDMLVANDHIPGGGMVNARDHIQQGGFSAARFPHDGDKLTVIQLQVYGFQRNEFPRRVFIDLFHITQNDGGCFLVMCRRRRINLDTGFDRIKGDPLLLRNQG